MAIAGVVIVTQPDKTMHVLEKLNETENVTTYGVHNDVQIIAVFEADSSKSLEEMSMEVQENIEGIMALYPAYVTTEDELENLA